MWTPLDYKSHGIGKYRSSVQSSQLFGLSVAANRWPASQPRTSWKMLHIGWFVCNLSAAGKGNSSSNPLPGLFESRLKSVNHAFPHLFYKWSTHHQDSKSIVHLETQAYCRRHSSSCWMLQPPRYKGGDKQDLRLAGLTLDLYLGLSFSVMGGYLPYLPATPENYLTLKKRLYHLVVAFMCGAEIRFAEMSEKMHRRKTEALSKSILPSCEWCPLNHPRAQFSSKEPSCQGWCFRRKPHRLVPAVSLWTWILVDVETHKAKAKPHEANLLESLGPNLSASRPTKKKWQLRSVGRTEEDSQMPSWLLRSHVFLFSSTREKKLENSSFLALTLVFLYIDVRSCKRLRHIAGIPKWWKPVSPS